MVMNESRLFVGNLSYQTMDNDLQDYFSAAGVVSSVNVVLDKFTGRSRGFAFVEFGTAEEAQKAVEMFHQKEFQGRALTVNIARPREERPPGGGGGGFRGDRGPRPDRGGIVATAGIVVTVATAVSGAIAASPQLSEVHGAGDPSGVSPAPVPRAGLTEIDTPVAQL